MFGKTSGLCLMQTIILLLLISTLWNSTWASAQTVTIQNSGSSRVIVKNGRVRASGDVIVGNGASVQRTYDCQSFHTLVSDQSMDITWGQGDKPSVVIEGDENIVNSMQVSAIGGILKIQSPKSFVSQSVLRAYVTSPSIRQAKLSGSGDLEVFECRGDEFIVDAQGSGDISVSGNVKRLVLRLSGSGDVDAVGCDAESVRVSMNGSGDVTISCSGRVTGSMNGAGDLTISGNAVINVRNDGAGEIYTD